MMDINVQGDESHKVIGQVSYDVLRVEELLRTVPEGGEMTYAAITNLIGLDVQHEKRHVLESARKRLERDERILFDVKMGEGLVRLDDKGRVRTSSRYLIRIRKASGKAIDQLIGVKDYASLPKEAQVKHNTLASVYGFMHAMSKPSCMASLQTKVEQAKKQLDQRETVQATIEYFSSKR